MGKFKLLKKPSTLTISERQMQSNKGSSSFTVSTAADGEDQPMAGMVFKKQVKETTVYLSEEHNDFLRWVDEERRINKISKGKITIDKKHEYVGEVTRDGVACGKGVIKYSWGDSYEGRFKDNKEHGFGVYRWADGSRCEGEMTD